MYTETKIWKKTLESNNDQFDHHRETDHFRDVFLRVFHFINRIDDELKSFISYKG